jgi:hypothetical protein
LPQVRMRFERREGFAERVAGRSDTIKQFVLVEVIENGVAGRG